MKKIYRLIAIGFLLSTALVLVLSAPGVVKAQYACTYHSYERCSGNNLYWYDSCGTQQDVALYCTGGCSNNVCQNFYQYNTCTYHSYEKCVGNNLYWYDSCGTQQDVAQYCTDGCYNNVCQNYFYNNSCTSHSYEQCSGNILYWYDSCGTQQDVGQYCATGCYNNLCQNNYNNNGLNNNSALTAVKTVKNLTSGTSFANSINASPSDMLLFMITLKATGQDVQNVLVKDTLPANLIYSNQLVVACAGNGNNSNCSNNIYNYSGIITSGINLNTIYAGQTVTITYQAQLAAAANFAYGNTTLSNYVIITSSSTGYTSTNNASIIVTKSTVLGATTVSTGLTNNFWVDSFLLPMIIALIGTWMWRAGIFLGIEKWMDSKRKVRRGYKAKIELNNRIAKIRKTS